MTKYILTLILLLLSIVIYGQDGSILLKKIRIKPNLHVGINNSFFLKRIGEFGDGQQDMYKSTIRSAISIGVDVEYKLSKFISFGVGISYFPMGGAYKRESRYLSLANNDKVFERKIYKLDYLHIPLFVTYDLCANISVNGGLSPAFILSSKFKYNDFTPTGGYGSGLSNYNEEYKQMELMYVKSKNLNSYVGLKYRYRLNEQEIFLLVKYTYDLLDSFEIIKQGSDNMKTHSNSFLLGVGLGF